ncbi:MAG: glycosyltransferase family 2 protein [Acidimicrobiia bacterium]|nr:glycosyltransferase family 2 protein [Acidimicrobiia bacterium]
MSPRVSIVVPIRGEGEHIEGFLESLFDRVTLPCEVLAVYEDRDDPTVAHLRAYAQHESRLVPTHHSGGGGPALALRYGIDHAEADVIVVIMADGSDDPSQIDALTNLVERGVVVAAASRYMKGGQQVGGPLLKSWASRVAGVSLYWLARVGTRDAANSFKAYNRAFVEAVGIDSDTGFEMGIELVAKARRRGLPVAEIPTIWLDTGSTPSNFRIVSWMPRYLRWYRHAFGRRVDQPVTDTGVETTAWRHQAG